MVPLALRKPGMRKSFNMTPLKPAVFLDRDGVVIGDTHYVHSIDKVRLLSGSAEAIAELNRAGWPVVIVTNQAGIARGFFSVETLHKINDHMAELLRGHGARVDGVYYCPHHPEGDVLEYRRHCECRKPKPGMLLQAARELGLDLTRSWMIGDRITDLEAGSAVGCRTVLVRTGYGNLVNPLELDREALKLELISANLSDAVTKLGLISKSCVA
jgi:D-glycero-D-manno-heptose 1,7-bisphosphate phosphatase